MKKKVQLSTSVLKTYCDQADLSFEKIIKTLTPSEATIKEMQEGLFTPSQIEKLSKKLSVPLGALFLNKPRIEPDFEIPSFRRRNAEKKFSPNLRNLINDILYKRDWYRDYAIENDYASIDCVGKFKKSDDLAKIVKYSKNLLNVPKPEKLADADIYYKNLARAIEKVGILLIETSYYKTNKKKGIDLEEVLGFAISDKLAPLIYINTRDSTPVKVFTLIHEFAHLLIDESNITDNGSIQNKEKSKSEYFCNNFASEFLVPQKDFLREWDSLSTETVKMKIDKLRKKFKISHLAIALIALKNNKINQESYNEMKDESIAIAIEKNKKNNGGPSAKIQKELRRKTNSPKLSELILNEVSRGNITYREASNVLNCSINKVHGY